MDVHQHHPVHSHCFQQPCNVSCRNRHSGRRLAVLSRISIVRDHDIDLSRAGSAHGGHHQQQLHEVLVHWRAGRLHDEDVFGTHVIFDLDADLAVVEATYLYGPQLDFEDFCDFLCESFVGVATKDDHVLPA